jgi:hypothetical protein
MAGDATDFHFWVNNPDFRLFKEEDPNNPEWCTVAAPLVEWGDNLIDRLRQDPLPGKIGFAKWKLLDRYARLYYKTKPVHRPEVNGGDHACIHDALLAIWQKLEDVEIQSRVPELEPPKLEVLPSPQQRVIEVEEEPTEEVSGIIMGFEEQKARENETEDVDA